MSAKLTSGARLGPYEIVSPIGAGGMGEVFLGRDTRLDRSVAVKVLPAHLSSHADLRERFDREARAISSLSHPHICALYDVGHQDGIDYLVMEYLEGESLADRLSRGPLPIEQVLKYGAQIAEALERAHRSGIVHRDLKPGNVMITKSGAKLLDFGLAKTAAARVDASAVTALATEQKPLTAEGTLLGTFQYMAPEQIEGLEADPRTDIFALGALLYEMATGRRAFEGKSKASLIASILDRQPAPISSIQPLTPPAFEHVVARCLSKERDDRWQSAHDIAEQLKWISEGGSQAGIAPAVITKRKSRERWLWLAVLLVGITAAVAMTTNMRPVEKPFSYHFLIPQSDGGYTRATWPLLSPDGQQVVFFGRNAGNKRLLYVRRLDDFTVKSWDVADQLGGELFWLPDSTAVAGFGGGKLRRVDLRDGSVQVIADVPVAQNGAWSEDGTILLGANERPLVQIPASGGRAIPITKPDRSRFEVGHHAPIFLPGGKRFLFISFTRNPSEPESPHTLYAGEVGSPEIRKIGEVTSKVRYARGYLFYVRGGSLIAVPFDPEKLVITGQPLVVAQSVGFFQPTGTASFSVSADGTVAWLPRPEASRLVITDSSGKYLQAVGPRGDMRSFRMTPDRSGVVVTRRNLTIGTFDLWLYGVTRPTATRLTFEAGEERAPVWSPDGATLYYSSDRNGVPDIYAKQVDSAEEDKVVLATPGDQDADDISPDGAFFLYTSNLGDPRSGADLYALSLRDGRSFPVVRSPSNDGDGRFSPDGRWVAYVSEASGRSEVYIKPFPGPGPARQVSTDEGSGPRWSLDGKTIYYRSALKTIMRATVDAAGNPGEPSPLFTYTEEITGFEPLPDGRFFLNIVEANLASPSARVIVRWPDSAKTR